MIASRDWIRSHDSALQYSTV